MPSISYPQLMPVTAVPTSAGAVYTNSSSGVSTMITCIIIHNTSVSNRTVTLNNVPGSGGAPGTATTTNEFAKMTIAAGDTAFLEPQGAWVLATQGDSIQAVADSTGVTIQCLGSQYS